jgi:hypothetical protein
MQINLGTTLYDLDGSIAIDVSNDSFDGITSRRVSRVATLDRGVAVSDGGYAEGDRTLDYTWRTVSKDHNDSVERLVKVYPELWVSTSSGVFLVSPSNFTAGAEESTIQFLVKSRISE